MKKLLWIVLLGLFLSSNVYAASKYVYLSCPSIIYQNKNKGKYKDSELYKIGSYIGHTFLNFKEKKKKTKWTTVTLYTQGNSIPPTDQDLWMSFPPQKDLKEKFVTVKNTYFLKIDYGSNEVSFLLVKKNKKWGLTIIQKLGEVGINFTTNSTFDRKNFDYCETVDKQEFNELIKKGIKINTETKSNDDLTQQLMNLNGKYKYGILTKEEFEKAKKKLLN